MAPRFLADQIDRSRANLGVDTIDVFYLHNPETQLGFAPPDRFYERVRAAFAELEEQVRQGRIRRYGAATWDGFRKNALDLRRMAGIAREEGGEKHHFRFIQLPFNPGMVEAYLGGAQSVLQTAAELGIAVVASATLAQTQALAAMPEGLTRLMPDLTPAQRAIQFARSTPGIAVALVGMSRVEHVAENTGVAALSPLDRDTYARLYQ